MDNKIQEDLYSLKGRSETRAIVYNKLREQSGALYQRSGLLTDIQYGPTNRERLDIFPQIAAAPIFVFIHGGYWRALEKEVFLAVSAPFARRGFVAVNVEYGLRPDFTLPEIIMQIQNAICFIAANAGRYGGRSDRIILCGHSAGGHMVAWAAAANCFIKETEEIKIRAVIPISGIFELSPLRYTSINEDLDLDADTARMLSPIHRLAQRLPPILSVVGREETEGFVRQSRNYTAALNLFDHEAKMLIAKGLDHFTICQAIADPNSDLFAEIIAFIEAHI